MTAGGCGATLNVHAATVVVGEHGILIRGDSGAGKTSLALAVVDHVRAGGGFARLVADDRTLVVRHGDLLVARPHPALAGHAERRGFGIVSIEHEPACVLGVVVDLVAGWPERHPDPAALRCEIAGVALARIAVAAGPPNLDIVARVATASTMSGTVP